jgi:HPt (histidine-containing phosphotransfer) domain-containing protein
MFDTEAMRSGRRKHVMRTSHRVTHTSLEDATRVAASIDVLNGGGPLKSDRSRHGTHLATGARAEALWHTLGRLHPAGDTLSKVDPTVIAELRRIPGRGSVDLYSRLVDLFETGSADALAQLCAALEASSCKPACAICHKLKSSAANVGALAFAQRVGQLEQLCIEGDITRALGLLEGLQAAQPALIAELTNS